MLATVKDYNYEADGSRQTVAGLNDVQEAWQRRADTMAGLSMRINDLIAVSMSENVPK